MGKEFISSFGAIIPGARRRSRARVVREFVAAMNAQDYDRAVGLVTPEFVFADTAGGRIDGTERFVTVARVYYPAAGYPTVVLTELLQRKDMVLARGHLTDGEGAMGSRTLWQISFRGNRIGRIEVTRSESQTTLPSFSTRMQ